MKRYPEADFRVYVTPEWGEVDVAEEERELFHGVYSVNLNDHIDIRFVPDVSEVAPPWGIHVFGENHPIATPMRARVWSLRTAWDYCVTPNVNLAGTEEQIPLLEYEPCEPGDPTTTTLWYVGTPEWTALENQLSDLVERTGRYHVVRFSELGQSPLARFLNERFLPSNHLTDRTLEILCRTR
ncbi:hypothetical protein [Nocardia sp. NPDC005825]|uniref:hypothetical protein n=1 Tax=unclassified Nocardia TaxID=2637762 RepID=UPI0033DE74C6